MNPHGNEGLNIMKSNIIIVDSQSRSFERALEETNKVAAYMGLSVQDAQSQMFMMEEVLSLTRSVIGDTQARFWIETEGQRIDLRLVTEAVLSKDMRYKLIHSTTSRKNEAAKGVFGKLRDSLEQSLAGSEATYADEVIPQDLSNDVPNYVVTDPEWDGLERKLLRNMADDVKIAIRGRQVDITVSKDLSNSSVFKRD